MRTLFQDLRYTVRALRRSAGLTLVIVASLAIGIGANTAVFSVVNALLLKPLPYPDPDRLAVLWLRSPGISIPQDWPSPGQYLDVQAENRSFDEIYRRLGVREIWIWRRGRLAAHALRGDAYEPIGGSEVLPGIDLDELASHLDRPTASQAVREYRERIRERR